MQCLGLSPFSVVAGYQSLVRELGSCKQPKKKNYIYTHTHIHTPLKKASKQFCNENCALIKMYWTIIIKEDGDGKTRQKNLQKSNKHKD